MKLAKAQLIVCILVAVPFSCLMIGLAFGMYKLGVPQQVCGIIMALVALIAAKIFASKLNASAKRLKEEFKESI